MMLSVANLPLEKKVFFSYILQLNIANSMQSCAQLLL